MECVCGVIGAVHGVIGAVQGPVSNIVIGWIHDGIKNFLGRESNFNALQHDTDVLIGIKGVVERKLSLQEQTEKSVLQIDVEDWVKRVKKLEEQVKTMTSSVPTVDGAYDLSCSCSVFPKLCKLSNQLVEKMEEVRKLTEAGKSLENKMIVPDKPIPVEHITGPTITDDQETAYKNLTKLLDRLKDDKVTSICVYGMGGVGKTTLVQNLNNKLKEEPTPRFSIVIWVTVSRDTNRRKIQTRIAERLKLEVKNEESDETVTSQLHERLKKEKCFLLILDDVWEDIDLQKLGIPNPEECPRSKILITSRSLGVCSRMSTKDAFTVSALDHDEAWDMFHKHAGEVAVRQGIQALAEDVAKECAGLPLALTIVGATMKGKSDVRIWKNALTELQKAGPDGPNLEGIEKVFKPLKLSYDKLPSKITQSCFLFCCLYPEDYNISVTELVRYWYCEGLLDVRLDYEERENKGIAIIQGLRDCCLLEEGLNYCSVKVHDVVRDVGKWIACSGEDEWRSIVQSGIGLTCVKEALSHSNTRVSKKEELLPSYKRVSFMDNRIGNLDVCVEQCSKVSTLLLQRNPTLKTIPISFLKGFKSLEILDLSYSMIESLPSLDELKQLRALILLGCSRLKKLPALDDLSGLLVLDCGGTGITQLPITPERLSNLTQLDLSESFIQTFPYDAISGLHKLELLNLSRLKTPLEGQKIFEAVLPLKCLTMFYACVDSIPCLDSNDLESLERIKELHLSVSTKDFKTEIHMKNEKYVVLRGLLSPESIEWSLRKSQAPSWFFEGGKELAQTLKTLAVNAGSRFASLKELKIVDTAVSYRADGTGASFDLLPKLEKIYLDRLPDLESVSDFGNILGLSFSKLKLIWIARCPRLKCVFSLKENQKLEELRVMRLRDCPELECVFQYPQDMDLVPAPKLQKVSLIGLPNLESLSRNCMKIAASD